MKPEDARFVPRRRSDRLAPCPFCGSTELGFYEYTYAVHFAVACRECGAQGPSRPEKDKAAALWNGRAVI